LKDPTFSSAPFQEVVFAHDPARKIYVEMKFRRASPPTGSSLRRYATLRGPVFVSFQIEFDKKSETILLRDLKVVGSDPGWSIEVKDGKIINLYGKEVAIPIEFPHAIKRRRGEEVPFISPRHFIWNISRPGARSRDFLKEFHMRQISNYLEEFFDQYILYLGPLREYPKRYYISSGEKPSDVGLRGERTVDFLYLERSKILARINYWLRKFQIARKIGVVKVAEGVWKVELINPETGISDNLKDVGFGVSQILPIVTEGMMAEPLTTIIIEQPEIHLHPRAQAELADLFIELAKAGKFSVIETHSEHMVLRFARRIAEGLLDKEDIMIYEFKLLKDGTRIREISFDDYGNLKEWPAEFFETELDETMRHVRAQGKRRKEMNQGGNIGG
jgi:hypothetical protein